MSPATAKKLLQLIDHRVVIEWNDPSDDWPHFTLIDISPDDSTIFLRGEHYPSGYPKHDGDSFWADWSDVKSIEPLEK
jgi:hypothetical protein